MVLAGGGVAYLALKDKIPQLKVDKESAQKALDNAGEVIYNSAAKALTGVADLRQQAVSTALNSVKDTGVQVVDFVKANTTIDEGITQVGNQWVAAKQEFKDDQRKIQEAKEAKRQADKAVLQSFRKADIKSLGAAIKQSNKASKQQWSALGSLFKKG